LFVKTKKKTSRKYEKKGSEVSMYSLNDG